MLQHRGGRPGFLRAISPTHLAFADYKGYRQMLSTSNLAANDRVALFLMDYPRHERLKIIGHARVLDVREYPELIVQLADQPDRKLVERVFLIDVVSFDWNCPKYLTPRYTKEEVRAAVEAMTQCAKTRHACAKSCSELAMAGVASGDSASILSS